MDAGLATPDKKRPLIWALTTGRVGDDSQVLLAAKAAGGVVRTIDLKFNRLRKMPNLLMRASLRSLKNAPEIGEPWPDLVVGAGCRSVSLSLWIRKQSGGHARLVRLGRPRAPLDWFDLVVTTPQYRLPASENVFEISLPLASPPAETPASDGSVVAVLGGDSRTCRITPEFAQTFARRAMERAEELGANLKIVTSPRTPPHAVNALPNVLPKDVDLHVWERDTPGPYHAWLQAAQACLVTGDSASTIADAILTTRPVTVIMPPSAPWLSAVESIGGQAMKQGLLSGGNRSFLAPPPDIDALIFKLIGMGCAHKVQDDTIVIEGASDMVRQEHARAGSLISDLASASSPAGAAGVESAI